VPEEVVLVRIVDPPVRHLIAMERTVGPRNTAADRALELLVELSRHPSRSGRRRRG
jgi:hypothetical protein